MVCRERKDFFSSHPSLRMYSLSALDSQTCPWSPWLIISRILCHFYPPSTHLHLWRNKSVTTVIAEKREHVSRCQIKSLYKHQRWKWETHFFKKSHTLIRLYEFRRVFPSKFPSSALMSKEFVKPFGKLLSFFRAFSFIYIVRSETKRFLPIVLKSKTD